MNQLFSNLIGNSLKFFDPERKGKINIVKQIVEKHNGTIEMESEVNTGAKFTIFVSD
jgi:signal transduction histidine kinase